MKASILLVDNDHHYRQTIRQKLQNLGYSTQGISCGYEALEAILNHQPETVILSLKSLNSQRVNILRQMKIILPTPRVIVHLDTQNQFHDLELADRILPQLEKISSLIHVIQRELTSAPPLKAVS